MARFELNILGCGSAKPTLRHNPSCQVVNIHDKLYMIDCGEGAQLQMMKTGLKWNRLNHIFISHLHGDHCFGLPGLLSTMALNGRGGDITVHIFKDGAELFKAQTDYFCREMPFDIHYNVIEMKHAVIHEDNSVRVTAIPLKHRVPAVGFLFEETPTGRHINGETAKFHEVPHYFMQRLRDGEDFVKPDGTVVPNSILTTHADTAMRYAYISDTMPATKIIPCIKDVDWLYHEATYADDCEADAKRRFHSTARQAARAAVDANAKNLILGHYSSRYKDENILLNEARKVFANTILADEGLKIIFKK